MAKRTIYKYLRGTYEELDIIDEDMKQMVGQSLKDYIWEHVIKPWVEQSPNIPNGFLELPDSLQRKGGRYRLRLTAGKKRWSLGYYYSKKEAITVRDYIIYKNKSEDVLPPAKPQEMNYNDWILDLIENDEGYKEYLENNSE